MKLGLGWAGLGPGSIRRAIYRWSGEVLRPDPMREISKYSHDDVNACSNQQGLMHASRIIPIPDRFLSYQQGPESML